MNIPFFTDYLMLSNPLSIGIIAVFVLVLIGIYVLQRKGTSFGNLVIIGTIAGAVLGIAVQLLQASLMIHPKWFTSRKVQSGSLS